MLNVVILSMVPQRDWEIDRLIARELKARGHNACVRNYLQDGRAAIIAEKPDVVIMPVIRCTYSRDFAFRLKEWGIRVISRRSEAGVSRKQYEKLPVHWKLDQIGRYDYKDLIDLELVWSQEFSDILIEERKIRSDQAVVIGGISLDLYFQHDLAKESPKILEKNRGQWMKERKFDASKKTLFFCSGFVHADRPGYCLPEATAGDPIHEELYLRDNTLRKMWIETIQKIAARKKYNVLVRPHQSELWDLYHSLSGCCVSVESTAGECLYHSDCLIHAGSTLAIESHLLGKPAFTFGSTAQDELIRDVSPFCAEGSDLLKAIEKADWGKSNARIKNFEDLKKHFFGPIDGKAYMRCADAVCRFDYDPKYTPPARKIPPQWPTDELEDYSTSGVIRLENSPVIVCAACKKPFQNLTENRSVRCPHCSIMSTQRTGV